MIQYPTTYPLGQALVGRIDLPNLHQDQQVARYLIFLQEVLGSDMLKVILEELSDGDSFPPGLRCISSDPNRHQPQRPREMVLEQ